MNGSPLPCAPRSCWPRPWNTSYAILGLDKVLRLHMKHAIVAERVHGIALLAHAEPSHVLLEGGKSRWCIGHHGVRVEVIVLEHRLASELTEAAELWSVELDGSRCCCCRKETAVADGCSCCRSWNDRSEADTSTDHESTATMARTEGLK